MATFSQLVPRRFERRIAKLAIIMFVETEGEWDGCEAHTLDISAQGARVQAGIELTQGQVVKVATGEGSDPVTGRVVWVGKPASELEGQAGLEFLEPFNISIQPKD
jgi:hypothetical protein